MPADALLTLPLLLAAAFFAGALNAVAGGGSFLTLPALVFVGVPPVTANATGTLALLPGYLSGAWGFREDIRPPHSLSLGPLILLSLAGGSAGALLLLITPNATFRAIVPWLLLAATALFAYGPRLLRGLRGRHEAGPAATALGVLAVTVYGGYFNGGLGILLLALFGLLGMADLNAMNGLKNLVSAVLTSIAVAVYAWGGAIVWGTA
ncbi:MAG TPA: sulfite exporter TauE/SafE family protein, partial [Candidatus Competibacteraceae bacterium]|nr:sulfite exporter TauE/SafE family protein [Candidatus Competibacteraceae bacterium]